MTRIKDLPTFETLDSANWVAVDTNSEETESGKASVEVLSSYLSANLPFVQSVNQSTGISVNNSDPNNPLVGLSQSSQDALNLATTAVQPHILGGLAYQDQITVPDIDATGTPNSSSALFGDGVWRTMPGGGNMLSAIYDPQNISNDAFDLANHTGEVPPSSVNELGLTRRLSARVGALFDTVADLLSDTTLTYSNVSPGDIIEAQGFRYEVEASAADLFDKDTATDGYHVETAGGVKLKILPADAVPIEAFGVQSGSYGESNTAANTTAAQMAWDYSSVFGIKIAHLAPDLTVPYYVSGLKIRTGMNLEGTPNKTVYQLPEALHGGSGFFIDRDDDGVRYYRLRMTNILFATATSSVAAAETANQDKAGMAYVAIEGGYFDNVDFKGFGQGGMILARAEGGNEGLGYTNTSQDGNYGLFINVGGDSCGRYRSNEQERGAIVLLYKANSHTFLHTRGRGLTGSALIAMKYGNGNTFIGGSGESAPYVIRFGEMAGNNQAYGIRGEGNDALVKGYEYIGASDASGPLLYNKVENFHPSSTATDLDVEEGHNIWISGSIRDPLRFRRGISPAEATRADGLLDVLGLKSRGANGDPVVIMATDDDGRTTNAAEWVPRAQWRKNHTNPVSGDILGTLEFYNSDATSGAAGISAEIRAVMEGAGGQTAIAILTGTGTTLTERLRVRSNGQVQFVPLASAPAGPQDGDVYYDSGLNKLRVRAGGAWADLH